MGKLGQKGLREKDGSGAGNTGGVKLAYLYLAVTVSAWGSLYVAGKVVLEVLPPFVLLFFRYAIACVILGVLYWKTSQQRIVRGDRRWILLIGGAGYFLAIGLQLIGTKLCNASVASLINSINPVVIILLAIPILGERPGRNQIIAVAMTVIGAAVIIGNAGESGSPAGLAASVGSVIAWSYSSVIVRRLSSRYEPLTITFFGMLTAMVCALPAGAVELLREPVSWEQITPGLAAAVLYIGVVCSALALFLWNRALSMVDAATCSLFYPGQPLVSTLLGVILLGETISLNFLLGAGLIVSGILFCVLTQGGTGEKAVA